MYNNCNVIKKANIYFDGKVNSRTLIMADGTTKTLGFMQAGEYEFNTSSEELMEILNGTMQVKLFGHEEYKIYSQGDSFIVPENSSFKCIVSDFVDYVCSYNK